MTGFNMKLARHALVVFGVGLLLAGCGIASGKGSVAAGEKYQAAGKYRAAYIEAKKVLQRNDKDSAAWLLLGRASLMLGDPKDALNELQNAKKFGAPANGWALPLGRTLLVMGQYEVLLNTLPAAAQLEAAERVPMEVLRGDAYRGLGKAEPAQEAYAGALKADPGNVRALVGMATLALGNHDLPSAQKYVQQALAAGPKDSEAWSGKGDVAFAAADYAGADAAYQKALDLKSMGWLPQDRYYTQVRLADAQLRLGQLDKVLANVEQLEKMAPEQPYPHYLHAVVLYQQNHLDEAVAQLQQVLKKSPDNVPAQMLMGAVTYAQGNYAQAGMYLSNVMGAAPKDVAARKLLALTYFREGRSDQALATLRPAVPGKPTDAELLALLQRAVAEGAGTPKTVMAERFKGGAPAAGGTAATPAVATGTPLDPRLAPAGAALAKGDAAAAIQLLDKVSVTGEPATSQRATLLAMAYVRAGKPDAAVKTAAAFAAANPKDSAAHLLYATALVADNKHDEARAQYQQAIKLDAKNTAARMSLGSLDALDHRFPDAAAQYQAVLKDNPNDAAAMTALAQTSVMQNDGAGAIRWYKQAIAAAPKSGPAYLGLMVVYSRAGQFDQAAAVAKQLSEALPGNPAALNAYGAAELNAGNHAAALPPLEEAVKLAPTDALFRTNLARAQLLAKDPKAAEANLATVVKANPTEAQAAALLAFMKLQDHDLPGALAVAHGLQQQAASKVAGLTLEGDLYMADKAYPKAVQAYQEGLKATYVRPLVVKTFLALSAAKAAKPEAVLTTWLGKHPEDAATRLLLAQYYLGHTRNAQAAAQYQEVLKAHPTDIDALNNLAWIYTEQHDPKAVTLAEQAYKLAPAVPGIMDTYGWALLANNQPKPALPLLEKAAKAAPKVASIQYHLAVAQQRNGDNAGALATLAALQKSNAEFPERAAAEKLYRQLGGQAAGK